MRARGPFVCLLGASSLVLGSVVGCSSKVETVLHASPPNVVLISIDTLRPDRLGCYGARAVETPAIDRLAAEGVRFEHAFSPVPLTLPAHWTMHTGVEPWHHGVVDNGMILRTPPVATLAERFSAAGYDTAAFVSAFVLNRTFGLDRGFARFDDGPAADAALEQLLHGTAPADERVGRALAWLRRPRSKPLFLWLHLYDPHAPYAPPPAFRSLYPGRPYDGEVAFVDTQVARLLAGLAAAGIADRTLVVLVSDHGESLGEHGEATHGLLLYDATLRIPLIVRLPGGLAAGSVRDEAVGLADIAPTVLALAGLPAESGVDGIDLFHRPAESRREHSAISEYPRRRLGWSTLVAVRIGEWKFILAPRAELYHVARDPSELTDLAGVEREWTRDLTRAARRVERQLLELAADSGPVEASTEERAKLAALGYLTGSPPTAATGTDPKDGIRLMGEIDRATQLLAEGRLDEARSRFETLLRAEDPPQAVLEGLGRIARLQGRKEAAELHYLRLLERYPGSLTALAQLVTLAEERHDFPAAIARAREMVRWAPADGSSSRLLAEALLSGGDSMAAESEFRRGLNVAPRSGWLRLGLARYLAAAQRQGEAAEELDRLLADEEQSEELMAAAQAARAALPATE